MSLQKSNSYLRTEIKTLRLKLKQRDSLVPDDAERSNTKCDNCEMITSQILDKENKVTELEEDVDEIINENIKTKNEDGSYSHEVRLCVIELFGLEVAVEKVSPVIQSVLRHILGKSLDRSDLPNPTTTQAIIDEGHYTAKTFISEKLNKAENWGLGRDGTTRKKQKIVDVFPILQGSGHTKTMQASYILVICLPYYLVEPIRSNHKYMKESIEDSNLLFHCTAVVHWFYIR